MIHLVGLPHVQTTREFEWCAFGSKLRRLCGMLRAHEYPVTLYVGSENEADVDEHVPIVGENDLRRWFGGPWDRERVFDRWNPNDACWAEMNGVAIKAIRARIQPHDIIGITMGLCQQSIFDAFPNHVVVEIGVGYEGVLPNSHRVFESRAWQHYIYGKTGQSVGRFFDTVIPNAFDPEDLTFRDHPDDYLLFLGRHTGLKGLNIVGELAKRHRVITAGQGEERVPGAEYVGIVTGKAKADLLAGARAVLSPSIYVEPFGGVAVEAMLSGTPAITTDFGAYGETVSEGVSGFRCATLAEFFDAAEQVGSLDRHKVRAWAEQFTTTNVAPLYDRWLRRLGTLYGDGWYALPSQAA